MVGVISYKAVDLGYGTSIYLDSKGVKWEVCAAYDTLEEAERNFKWEDAMVVSEDLVKWISIGQPARDIDNL